MGIKIIRKPWGKNLAQQVISDIFSSEFLVDSILKFFGGSLITENISPFGFRFEALG